MPTLFMMCGLPGSGKTTLARQLEQERAALRLCPDEWIVALLADVTNLVERDRLREPVEAIQWKVAQRALALGINVILENGFWSRDERDAYRKQAEAQGARVELYYLDVGLEELWTRLSKRNADLPPGTFAVTREDIETWWGWFEAPTEDELAY